jgi:hypothetical protein
MNRSRSKLFGIMSACVLGQLVCTQQIAAQVMLTSPIEWKVENGGNGHWYQVFRHESGISWDAANLFSQSRQGYLATLTSSSENAFAYSMIDFDQAWTASVVPIPDPREYLTFILGPWIGAYQPDGEQEPTGGWRWTNGEGLVSNGFTNWATEHAEPNNGFLGPDNFEAHALFSGVVIGITGSVEARSNLWWDSATGQDTKTFLVEYNFAPVPEPEEWTAIAAGTLLVGAALRRWRVASDSKKQA